MNVGIIGAGRLGRALGARLADAGHELMYAGGASAAEAASAGGARAGSNSDVSVNIRRRRSAADNTTGAATDWASGKSTTPTRNLW